MNSNTSTQTTQRDVVITRRFDAPIELVWKAWYEPESVKRWWGPQGFTCPVARMDFREGGTSLVCMRAPKEFGGQDYYNSWSYQKIVPLERIEYILYFVDENGKRIDPTSIGLPAGMPQEVQNLVTFKRAGSQTELTVTEYGYPSDQIADLSKAGMEQCLDKMAAIFATA
jgi:uncharacterized protein YndB with AHSA1/START domain